jgi:predicted enzyme related to lactoylglutathione lyase
VIYVSSEDIDADLKRAIELGATKVLGKSEIAGWGQYAIFREPAGSRIALWKSAK